MLDTLNFNAYNRLGQINQGRGDTKTTALYFEKANKLNPTDADVAIDLSDTYILLNQPEKADKALNIAIAADPKILFYNRRCLRYTI